nr:aminoglycoside phosphotransferase family protein [Streptomyces sp. SID3343]
MLSRLLPDDKVDQLPVRQGQFHTVVIGSDRVVCLPRTRAAANRLPQRAAALATLAKLDLGFHTPEPLIPTTSNDPNHETPFLVLSRIPGEPLPADALNKAHVAGTAAAQYAQLLAELAHAGSDKTVRAALPHASEDRWRQFAAGVRTELFDLMSDSGRRRAERELDALDDLPHLTEAVVHGDLGPENVLWEWEHGLPHLTGVLDWDDVTLGDPAEDLAAIEAGHGHTFLAQVLTPNSRSNNELTTRITTIRNTFALQQALYAQRDNDPEQLADGLTHYR